MVYAAWRQKLPAALTEADAHLGLANRLAAPFARRVFLAYGIPGRDGAKYRVTGRPVPARPPRRLAGGGPRAASGCPRTAPVLAFFGALAGARSLNDFAVETYGDAGPAVLHVSGERDYERLRGAGAPRRLRARPVDGRVRRRARRARPRDLARRRHGLGARRGGHARDPRPVPARDRRPPDAERAALRARRRRGRRAGGGARPRARARRRAARRPGAARGDARGDAARWRGRTRPTRSRRS